MRRLESISDAQTADADSIVAVDPATERNHQLWGQESLARARPRGAPPYPVNTLEIELPEKDHAGLVALIDRIERTRGRLPLGVSQLRETLRQTLSCRG